MIAGMIGIFILRPVQSYDAQVRRAELVDAAESALRRMQRDIRRALPNSIRIRDSAGNVGNADCTAAGGVCVLELLYTVDGGRYRANPPPGAPPNRFQFGINETDFDVLGSLQNFALINPVTDWLVVNNQTTTGTQYNAYFGDNRGLLSNVATTATHINLMGKNFAAPLASPRQRFYIVNMPVTFLCDTNAAARTLTRYSGYPITTNHTDIDTPAELAAQPGVQSARAAELVSACTFTYQPGSPSRSGLVTIALTISDPQTSEQVRLLHQAHVGQCAMRYGSRDRSRGFSLVSAIFVLVILSALGAFMVTIGEAERATATYAVQGARAYHAAQSGIEWGIARALDPATRAATCGGPPPPNPTIPPVLPPFSLSGSRLDGFQVTVVCNYSEHQEGPPPLYGVFTITSTATYGTYGNPDYFSRSLVITVTNAP